MIVGSLLQPYCTAEDINAVCSGRNVQLNIRVRLFWNDATPTSPDDPQVGFLSWHFDLRHHAVGIA